MSAMAFRCQGLLFYSRHGCSKLKLLDARKLQSAIGSNVGQVANLTSVQSHGNEIKRSQPWPYLKRPYGALWQFFDHTTKRFNDNTKVIVVDGNLATGKTEFAMKLAKEFDLQFFPDYADEGLFLTMSGFDVSELNEQLPPAARTLDFATFYKQSAPADQLKTIGRTQLALYKRRFFAYAQALEHLLNTGQGVVIERGPWSDAVFAETLRKHGYMTQAGLKVYNEWRDNSVCELWKPHVVIYLDAPVSEVRKRINKRNNPAEVKGKVVTDEYLQTIEDNYKKKMLPYYNKYCKVMEMDITDMPDWDIIVEDLETLDLDTHPPEDENLFQDWLKVREDDWNHYRCLMSSKWQLDNLFMLPLTWDAPEMMISGEDYMQFKKIVEEHPEMEFAPGYNPEKYSTALKF